MGVSVRQKEKGRGKPWWVFVSHQGKRKSMQIGDKRSAEKTASRIREELAGGAFNLEQQKIIPAFGVYSKKWIEGYVKISLRESTLDEYDGILRNYVLPAFKDKKIDAISRGEVRDFLLSKYGDLSQSRVMLIKDVLSGVFNYALDEELININPTTGITKRLFPKKRKKKPIGKEAVFTREELELFLNTCESVFSGYYLFFLMAARTGMRLGELLALKWGDIDFKSSYIWVKRSYRRGRFTRPKNGKSRKVDMSMQLMEALSQFQTKAKREALKQGSGEMPEFIFNRFGRVIEQNFIRRVYKRTLRTAKLRYIKLHGFRHAFCAHLLSEGVTPYYVSQQAGHSSINITCDIYGSWIRTEENRHVNLLDSNAPTCTPYAPTNEKQAITACIH